MSSNDVQILQNMDGTWSATSITSHADTQSQLQSQALSSKTQEGTTDVNDPPPHCWICLQTQSEDETPRVWKSPCPCNLRAHEDCLLEWITDLEAPNTRRATPASKIQCPQCKSDIRITRPKDYLVSLIDLISYRVRRLVLPAGLSTIFTILATSSGVYGLNALSLVFGPQDADRIFRQSLRGMPVPALVRRMLQVTEPFMLVVPSWQALLGFPAIAPALILSRTNIADNVFLGLPILYFAWHHDGAFLRQWPPSPGLSFALLPYLRLTYCGLLNHTFGKLEQEWDRAVKRTPREGETAEEVAQGVADAEQDNIFNLEIELEIEGDDPVHDVAPPIDLPVQPDGHTEVQTEQDAAVEEGVAIPAAPDLDEMPPLVALPEPARAAPGAMPNGAAAEPAGAGDFVNEALGGREGISISSIFQGVLGALFLPSLSSLSGDILYYALPRRWVVAPTSSNWIGQTLAKKPTSILQERWARSLIGGCLFIACKDALLLYSKWRKAKSHAQRHIENYVDKGR